MLSKWRRFKYYMVHGKGFWYGMAVCYIIIFVGFIYAFATL